MARTRSATTVRLRVNLKAFCSSSPTAAADDLAIARDAHRAIDRADLQAEAVHLRLQRRPNLDLLDQLGHRNKLQVLDPHVEANIGERAIDEVAQPEQVADEGPARAPAHRDPPGLDEFEGEHRRVEQVAQLVREDAEALILRVRDRALARAGELRHRLRDRVVEAKVRMRKSSVEIGTACSSASAVIV